MTFLPRYFEGEVTLRIHNENINTMTVLTEQTAVLENEYAEVSFDYDFIQFNSYQLEVIGTGGLIFRCKAKAI